MAFGAFVALFLALSSAGCTTELGAFAARIPDGAPTTNAGLRVAGRVHPNGNRGLFVGAEESVAMQVGNTCCDQWRLRVGAGYAALPTVSGERVGFEAGLFGGMGRIPRNDRELALGAVFGPVFAVPIRLTKTRPPWQADDLLGRDIQLVPEGSLSGLLVGGDPIAVRYELAFGLALRMHVFVGALP
jgi:hypothetical protein